MITAVDHVQLSAPPGSEELLRAYYVDALGLVEVPRPARLATRGGCWFGDDDGRVRIHLDIETPYRASAKAHPGLRVEAIDSLAARLEAFGALVIWDDALPGHRRFHSQDPVGNRLEFLQPTVGERPLSSTRT
ncbi:glyoxalase [Streptomyces sp. IMTB 2501]|uniref:VOC family protein n=1 Tax=Streptomyces sp. IMTB 2501 TaxID=1776340 RepID=UPI00096FA3BD|nr:VOC family protein [Streptomyces sp. IMTB 2501]OLZ65313.1 glyoxalase [Streptomyces sp. IMTB 2501]